MMLTGGGQPSFKSTIPLTEPARQGDVRRSTALADRRFWRTPWRVRGNLTGAESTSAIWRPMPQRPGGNRRGAGAISGAGRRCGGGYSIPPNPSRAERDAAHTMKGAAWGLGAGPLAEACAAAEQAVGLGSVRTDVGG